MRIGIVMGILVGGATSAVAEFTAIQWSNGDVQLFGDGSVDTVIVEPGLAEDSIRVRTGSLGPTNASQSFSFDNVLNLYLVLGDGSNKVEIANLQLAGGIVITGGSDEDTINLRTVDLGSLAIAAGDGATDVLLLAPTIRGDFTCTSGNGRDIIQFAEQAPGVVQGDIEVSLGEGPGNRLELNAYCHGDVRVTGGDQSNGANIVGATERTFVRGDVSVEFGRSRDDVVITGIDISGNVDIFTARGHDVVSLGRGPSYYLPGVTVRGTTSVHTGIHPDRVEILREMTRLRIERLECQLRLTVLPYDSGCREIGRPSEGPWAVKIGGPLPPPFSNDWTGCPTVGRPVQALDSPSSRWTRS